MFEKGLKFKVIAFLAPQGGGKDTQMDVIKGRLPEDQVAVISMSDVLRHYSSTDEEFGRTVSRMMSRGVLVGDDIIVQRLLMYIKECCKGKTTILLNGFPRTMAQAMGLWAIAMSCFGVDVSVAVIKFNLSHELAFNRVMGRIEAMISQNLKPRDDDTPELIEERLTTYFHNLPEIMSVLSLFAKVIEIDASKSVEEVTFAIAKAVAAVGSETPEA